MKTYHENEAVKLLFLKEGSDLGQLYPWSTGIVKARLGEQQAKPHRVWLRWGLAADICGTF